MKVNSSSVFDLLSGLRTYFQSDSAVLKFDKKEPFLSELFSSSQLDEHAKAVAKSHKLMVRDSSDQLLKRLEDNEVSLLEVRNILVESIRDGKDITPGAEWLLDNFYLIEEQVVLARKHLPKGYSEGLPYLANGNSAGMPRIYDIVLEIISHSDGRVDIKSLTSFIASYQTNTLLTLGELWAIPIMLRLAVLENLRRVGAIIALDMIDHNLANYWAGRMMTTIKDEPGNLILTIADMARSKPILDSSFVAGFIRELQGKGPALALPLSWMEQQLSGIGLSSNDLVRQETQKQAADQVSVRNSIGTLRFIGATDWRDFVEELSSVEQVLRKDITGIYPLMDFSTRDRYRHVVESISKFCPLSETEVAQKVLELTEKHSHPDPIAKRKKHVGYYLIDKGLKQAEQAARMRCSLKQKLIRGAKKMPVFLYLFSITFLTFTVAAAMWRLAYVHGAHSWLMLTLVGLLSISGSAQLAVSLVNWLCTLWVKPNFLPRMDFSTGIPAGCRTLVAIPTMLASDAYIEELVEALEIRFLANREAHLHYALVTDFTDADAETMPEDEGLLEIVSNRIDALNQKYKPAEQDTFFLFHRPRKWNALEGKWMGYERKRGKLSALNAFIRGRGQDEFSVVIGNYSILTQVKYVITLDSDTQLPREAAWKFIATMAHPLNQAIYSSKKKRVIDGYGILQPRVTASIPKTAVSLYLRMQGNVSGIDPYTKVSSDVYQDLFGEGSFIGKGIYDVDIFEQTVDGIFPENRILSHDLLEGCYTRSGMLSDVILYEDNPSQYLTDIKRHHRWIRGDWQIGAWMLPYVTGRNGRLTVNPLSALSRWKILDNLRRSVLPLSLILILILGWSVLPFPWFWTLTVTIIVLLPVMAATGWQLLNKPQEITIKVHLLEVFTSLRDVLIRFVFGMAVLPYEAFKYTDAVIRTNWRMIVTGRKLLQWTPSASASRNSGNDVWSAYRSMWMAPLLALVFIVTLLYIKPEGLLVAWPILILWLMAPAISWRLNSPLKDESPEFVQEELVFLHKTARKTWAFFEKFVSVEENWLPPDNFQEQPVSLIAHRTSPTNMGLALLANLSAYDFGYVGSAELIDRTNNTLQSMLTLERYNGHFYNWYDTLSLLPLQPRYVSTVDSGNLIGHLLTLRQGLLALNNQPILSESIYHGIETTVSIIEDFSKSDDGEVIYKIKALLSDLENGDATSLSKIKKGLDELIFLTDEFSAHDEIIETDIYNWESRLKSQLERIREDLIKFVPWLELLPVPDRFQQLILTDRIPSLLFLQDIPNLFFPIIDHYEQEECTVEEKDWLSKMR
ncbi:MAG: glycosyltransferase family protein, partial [Daejeonella sp.]